MEPLSTLAIDGRTYIVARRHGYESIGYVISEVKRTAVKPVFEVEAGGC